MTETARMYGGSLYDLAAEEGLEARILGELDEAVALFKANPDYLHLLSTPPIFACGLRPGMPCVSNSLEDEDIDS